MPSITEVDNIKSLDDSGQTSILTKTGTGVGGDKVFTLDNVVLGSSVDSSALTTGSWVKLGPTISVGTSSSVLVGWNATTEATRFVSTYKTYKIIGSHLRLSANGGAIRAQACVGVTSGTPDVPTSHTTALYRGVWHSQNIGYSALAVSRDWNLAYWEGIGGFEYYIAAGNAQQFGSCEITLYSPSDTDNDKTAKSICTMPDITTGYWRTKRSEYTLGTNVAAFSALTLYPSSGTFDGGTFDLYGIA